MKRSMGFFLVLVALSFCGKPLVYAKDYSIFQGEKISFAIRKFGIRSGSAELVFEGKKDVKGHELYLLTFTARALNFLDEERIYVDPETFYPVMVTRNLNIFGKKEKIVEHYWEDKGIVKIIKEVGGRRTEETIQKEGRIDNIYCFIYRFRLGQQRTTAGDSLRMHLPTKDVTMKIAKKMRLKANGKVYNSFFLESNPSQYKVWFDTGQGRLPLRIDGAAGLMSTSMVMSGYDL